MQVYAILSDGSLGPGTVVAPVRSPTEDESGCPAEEEGGTYIVVYSEAGEEKTLY